jgi:hypothetical protein
MNAIDHIVWVSVQRWLERRCRGHKAIRHCFIRHSTAGGAQGVLLADFDLIFFVDGANFDDVLPLARRLHDRLRILRVFDCITLPATAAAYRLCASHYPFRSIYPMESWRRVHGEELAIPAASRIGPPPLDHVPEAFLLSYVLPVLRKKRKGHILQRALLRRKLNIDSVRITGQPASGTGSGIYDVLAAEVRLWDQFYRRLGLAAGGSRIQVRTGKLRFGNAFSERWHRAGLNLSRLRGLASLWVYPCFFDRRAPYVAVNLEEHVTSEECSRSIRGILTAFDGLDFRLHVGTEQSMRARLGGLSRVSLIDPWLFKSMGQCLAGDETTRDQVREPALEEVKEKLKEYLLYLSYRVFCLRPYPYALYSLAFALDQLFRRHELITDEAELGESYGKVFLPPSQLQGPEGRSRFLGAWKELHGFDLFEGR